ncbi:MAG: efflux RND transporter periplasmic adaptor subunit [Opitutales bacterium]
MRTMKIEKPINLPSIAILSLAGVTGLLMTGCGDHREENDHGTHHDHSAHHDHGSHSDHFGDEEVTTSTTVPHPVEGLFCHEHGVAEIECGICQPQLAASLQPGKSLKVRFLSGQAAEKAGIKLGYPRPAEISPAVPVYCETRYNENALARITPLVDGVVRAVHKELGEQVREGEPLADIHSSGVASAKSDYLSALVRLDIAGKAHDRLKRLDSENIAAEKDLIAAEGDYRSALFDANRSRQHLLNLGMSADTVRQVEEDQDTSALLTIRAPFAGTLVERHAVVGEAVESGHALYTLVELSRFWIDLSIPPDNLNEIGTGQPVEAVFPDLGKEPFHGEIAWIDSSIDRQTRMIRARAVVDRSERPMSAGLFGRAYIMVGQSHGGALLPKVAVQRYEGADFVFVREEDDLFSLRRVEIGLEKNGEIEVLRGLQADEQVVIDGSFIAMSEFLKFRLGAGCVH